MPHEHHGARALRVSVLLVLGTWGPSGQAEHRIVLPLAGCDGRWVDWSTPGAALPSSFFAYRDELPTT